MQGLNPLFLHLKFNFSDNCGNDLNIFLEQLPFNSIGQ